MSVDLSWDEVAKYVVASSESVQAMAEVIRRHPERFLFGTDVVAPASQKAMTDVYDLYRPLWAELGPELSARVLRKNYERIFDTARRRVRDWEKLDAASRAGTR